MPTPNDTDQLLHRLQSIQEQILKLDRLAELIVQEMNDAALTDATRPMAEAAMRAGMGAARAFDYGEEYDTAVVEALRQLGAVVEMAKKAKDRIKTATHIVDVLPYRCPAVKSGGVRPVLSLI